MAHIIFVIPTNKLKETVLRLNNDGSKYKKIAIRKIKNPAPPVTKSA